MNCTHIRGCDDKGSEHVAMEVMQCSVKTNRISRRQLYFIGQNTHQWPLNLVMFFAAISLTLSLHIRLYS